jgi:hypothetical protein
MGHMTLDDRCYYGACGMCAVSTSPRSSDGLSDISGAMLLPPIVVTGYMTSDDHCYYWARGTRAVGTSHHSNHGLAIHCYWTTSSNSLAVCCYWTDSSDGLSSVVPLLLDCIVAIA